jgi:hypothetical protein
MVIAPPSQETIGFHVDVSPLSELAAVSSADGAAQATAKSGRRRSEAIRFMDTLDDYRLKSTGIWPGGLTISSVQTSRLCWKKYQW